MVKQHLLAFTGNTVHEPHTHALLLKGTALDDTLRPPVSWLMQHFPLICLSRISHAGFTPGLKRLEAYRCIQCSPCQNLAFITPHIFALALWVTKRRCRKAIFTFTTRRSPAWFPRSAPLVQHTQPGAAAEGFPERKEGGGSREQCSTTALARGFRSWYASLGFKFCILISPGERARKRSWAPAGLANVCKSPMCTLRGRLLQHFHRQIPKS